MKRKKSAASSAFREGIARRNKHVVAVWPLLGELQQAATTTFDSTNCVPIQSADEIPITFSLSIELVLRCCCCT